MAHSRSVGQLIGLVTKFIASSHNLPIVQRSGEKLIQLRCASKYNINPWHWLKHQAATSFLPRHEITITTCNSVLPHICGIVTHRLCNPESLSRHLRARSEDVEPARPVDVGTAFKTQSQLWQGLLMPGSCRWFGVSSAHLTHLQGLDRGSAERDSSHSPRNCLKIE